VKALVKTLIACALLSFLAACSTKNTSQDNTSTGSSGSSQSDASSPTIAKEPSDSGTPSVAISPASTTATATKIDATLKEMAIQLSSTTAPAGVVEFVVRNEGKVPHEFVVLKNDLKDKNLPLKGEKLDEDAKGLKNVGEIDEGQAQKWSNSKLKSQSHAGTLPHHLQRRKPL
jgi:uncharacterized cupredoxin-like copper-binding protein